MRAAVLAAGMYAWNPSAAGAATTAACEVEGPVVQGTTLKLKAGAERARVWITAEYGGLQIRKFTAKGGASVFEFVYGDDTVVVSLSKDHAWIGRNGVARELRAPESVDEAYQLLSGSPAIYQARVLLSRLERTSALRPGHMTILSAAAFVAMLTGDVEAPQRLADRFAAMHRQGLRLVRARLADDEDSCWTKYSNEVNAAANDETACEKEAMQTGGWLVGVRILACQTIWLIRAESAWFEYLNCVGAGGFLPKLE